MPFKNRFKSFMFSCLSFVEELSYESHVPGSSVAWLPDSVILEILLKLPVPSIIRCKGVCKGWYRLILDPYFAKVYFNNDPYNPIAIIQQSKYPKCFLDPANYCFYYVEIGRTGCVFYNPLDLKPVSSLVKRTIKGQTSWKNLIGSCDGLLCLIETPCEEYFWTESREIICSDNANITVCIVNPLMGEYMSLPELHVVNHDSVVYGFGSTVDGDHYKIVKVAMKYDVCVVEEPIMESHGCVVVAQILTIGVDKNWREVDISSMPLHLYSHGVTLNGVLHWVGDGGNVDTPHGVIYAFDILKEKGQCFKLPCVVGRKACQIYLGVWNGHLCITDSSNEFQIDIWTMKQYGLVGSWSKDIVLKYSIRSLFFKNLIPITTFGNGHLLLSFGFGYIPSFISPHNIISKKISIRDS